MWGENVRPKIALFQYDMAVLDPLKVLAAIRMIHFMRRLRLPIDCDDFGVQEPFMIARN